MDENQSICNATTEVCVYTNSNSITYKHLFRQNQIFANHDSIAVGKKNSGRRIIKISAVLDLVSTRNTGLWKILVQAIVGKLNITNTGSGETACFDLVTQLTDVLSTSSGHVKVNVMDTMNVNLTGLGNVYYIGNPVTNLTDTGSGSVMQQ